MSDGQNCLSDPCRTDVGRPSNNAQPTAGVGADPAEADDGSAASEAEVKGHHEVIHGASLATTRRVGELGSQFATDLYWGLLKRVNQTSRCTIGDLYAMGCYLHSKGHKSIGIQLCIEAFDFVEMPHSIRREFIELLEGNEVDLGKIGWAHSEVLSLLEGRRPDLHPIPIYRGDPSPRGWNKARFRIRELCKRIDAPQLQSILADLFVIGCYMYAQKYREAGLKLCRTARLQMGYHNYYFPFQLRGHERHFAEVVGADRDVLGLFDQNIVTTHGHPTGPTRITYRP